MPLHPPAVGHRAGGSRWPKTSLTYPASTWGLGKTKDATSIPSFFPFLLPFSNQKPKFVAVLCAPGPCADADGGCGDERADMYVCGQTVSTPALRSPSHLSDPKAGLPPWTHQESGHKPLISLEKCHTYHCWGFLQDGALCGEPLQFERFWGKKIF